MNNSCIIISELVGIFSFSLRFAPFAHSIDSRSFFIHTFYSFKVARNNWREEKKRKEKKRARTHTQPHRQTEPERPTDSQCCGKTRRVNRQRRESKWSRGRHQKLGATGRVSRIQMWLNIITSHAHAHTYIRRPELVLERAQRRRNWTRVSSKFNSKSVWHNRSRHVLDTATTAIECAQRTCTRGEKWKLRRLRQKQQTHITLALLGSTMTMMKMYKTVE